MIQPTARWLLTGSVAFALLAVSVVAPGIAGAELQETQTVSEDAPIEEEEFGPILASDPGGAALNPDDCTISPTCHTIPLDIVVPDLADGGDFLVRTSLAFDAPTGAEDLDIYFWDNKQTLEAEGEGESGYTQLSSAASAENPETFSFLNPTLGRYNLTVSNFSGFAITYRLSIDIRVLEGSTPFESLAPTANRGGGSQPPPGATSPAPATPTAPGAGTTPVRPSAGVTPSTPSSPSTAGSPSSTSIDPIPGAPSLATSELPEDADFAAGSFADDSAFDDELAAPARPVPTEGVLFGREDRPSSASLLLWLVGVPLLLLAAAGGLLARRNPGMLRAVLPHRRRTTAAEA